MKKLLYLTIAIFAFTLAAPKAHAAATFIQVATSTANAAVVTFSTHGNVTANDVFVWSASFFAAGAPAITSVTSTCTTGNWVMTTEATSTSVAGVAGGYALITSSGACTINMNISASASDFQATAAEVSGINTATPLDVTSTINLQASPGTGTDAITSGIKATTVGGDFIYGYSNDVSGAGVIYSAGTGQAKLYIRSNQFHEASEYYVQAAPGNASSTFTTTANHETETFLIALQPASSAVIQSCNGIYTNGTNATSTCTFKASSTIGDTLVEAYYGNVVAPTTTVPYISGCSPSWNLLATSSQGVYFITMFNGVVSSSTCAVTLASGANNSYTANLFEVSGVNGTSTDGLNFGLEFDGNANQTGPNVTTTIAGDVVLAVNDSNSLQNFTLSSTPPFTQSYTATSSGQSLLGAFRFLGGTNSAGMNFKVSATGDRQMGAIIALPIMASSSPPVSVSTPMAFNWILDD